MEESIFIDKRLQGINGDEDEPLLSSTSSSEPISASTLETEATQATTSSTTAVEASRVEGGDHLRAESSLSHSEGTFTSADHR
jgi:hypothetical protein